MTNRTSGIEPHQHPGLSKTFVEEKLSPVVLCGQRPTICLVEPFGAGTFSRAEGRNGVTGLPQSFASEWHERLTDAPSFVARSDEQRPNPTVSHIARRKPWTASSSSQTQISERSMKSAQSLAVTKPVSARQFSRTDCLISMIRETSRGTARRMPISAIEPARHVCW